MPLALCQLWCTVSAMASASSDLARLARELSSARLTTRRSLREVATAAEISAAYLQKLERAQVDGPSPNILRRLADALGLEYARLMELAGYEVPRLGRGEGPLVTRFAATDLTETEERAVAAFIDHLIAQRG